MDNRIEFILLFLLIITLLFVPQMKDSILEFFDFAFINVMCLLIIFYMLKYKLYHGIVLVILYVFCITQRRKNIANIIILKQLNTLNISTEKKVNAVITVIKNENISNENKESLVKQIIAMEIPKIKKYEIINLYIDNGGNMKNIFKTLYNDKSIPHLAFTKMLFRQEYKQVILKNIDNSVIDDEIKTQIYAFINEKSNKKVSFTTN